MKIIRTCIFPIFLVLLMLGLAQACPTCKGSVAENGGNLVRGYFWSIVFMMSMPFLIFTGLCTLFYMDVRRARHKKTLVAVQVEPHLVPTGSAG